MLRTELCFGQSYALDMILLSAVASNLILPSALAPLSFHILKPEFPHKFLDLLRKTLSAMVFLLFFDVINDGRHLRCHP